MADTKTTALTENTTPAGTDVMYIVDDPGGTPASQKIQVANVGKGIKLDDLATPDNNTDLDATTTQHGLLPKLGAGTLNYLRTDGTWTSPFVYVRKTANETVASSTVLQDDNHLTFAVGANDVWSVDYTLEFNGSISGDLKLGISMPTDCLATCFSFGPGYSTSADVSDTTLRSQTVELTATGYCGTFGCNKGAAGNGPQSGLLRVLIKNAANAGNVVLQWAQQDSHATATTVYANSYLVAIRLA